MVNHFKKVIPFIIITILAIGGVEAFYRIPFTRLMQTSQAVKVQDAGVKIAVPVASEQKKHPDLQTILKRNLFGPPPKEVKAVTTGPAPETLAATALELSLLGTISGPSNTRRAILLDKKKKVQDIYYQGDTVQGAVIKEIQRSKIILDVNGKEEMLVPETPKTNPGGPMGANLSSPMPPEAYQEPPAEIPADGVVEPAPIVTPEPAEPVAPEPMVTPEPAAPVPPAVNTTEAPSATEVDKAQSHRSNQNFFPPNNNPSNPNNIQEKP
jgi:type II secretory pathway component PulC